MKFMRRLRHRTWDASWCDVYGRTCSQASDGMARAHTPAAAPHSAMACLSPVTIATTACRKTRLTIATSLRRSMSRCTGSGSSPPAHRGRAPRSRLDDSGTLLVQQCIRKAGPRGPALRFPSRSMRRLSSRCYDFPEPFGAPLAFFKAAMHFDRKDRRGLPFRPLVSA